MEHVRTDDPRAEHVRTEDPLAETAPDSDPLVTGVGGTQLHLSATGKPTAPAQVWNDTTNVPTNEFIFGNRGPNPLAGGGGKSVIFGRPAYQNGPWAPSAVACLTEKNGTNSIRELSGAEATTRSTA